MNKKLRPGKYEHYKGKYYEVYGVAKHSETLEEFAVYRTLYGKFDLWVRPLKMFRESVEIDGKKVPRFRYIKIGGIKYGQSNKIQQTNSR